MTIEPTRRALPMRNAMAGFTAAVLLAGCALHWPWHHRGAPVVPSVQEVALLNPAGQPATGVPITQFWDRYTLLLDLTAVSGEGSVSVAPIAERGGWPVRLEFRVRPGSFAQLEATAAQRVVFSVPTQGAPVVLKLAPGVIAHDSQSLTLRWSAAAD